MDRPTSISSTTLSDKMKPSSDALPAVDVSELGTVTEPKTSRHGFLAWAKKLSIETEGIRRVTDEDRKHNTTHVWNAATFWYVAFCTIEHSSPLTLLLG